MAKSTRACRDAGPASPSNSVRCAKRTRGSCWHTGEGIGGGEAKCCLILRCTDFTQVFAAAHHLHSRLRCLEVLGVQLTAREASDEQPLRQPVIWDHFFRAAVAKRAFG